MSKEYSDQDYYWEKAEFQDSVSHRGHLENYKNGIRSSTAFDEEYMVEAIEELKADPVEFVEKVMKIELLEHQKVLLRKMYSLPPNQRYILFPPYHGRTQAKMLSYIINETYGGK